MNKVTKNNKGFSLVELIIVIAIMAVLVAVLAPAFMRYVEESRQKADITAVDEIIQATKAAYTNSEFDLPDSGGIDLTISKTDPLKNSTDLTSNTNLKTALEASDVAEAKLKSSKWGTVTIHIDEATGAAGALAVTVSSNGGSVNMADKYNK